MENIGWWIAGVIAAICIVGIVRIAKEKAICYFNIWDFLAGTVPVIAVGVGLFMINTNDYSVRQHGALVLWIAGPLTILYHISMAIICNHENWFDAPVMFMCRLCGIVTTVLGILLAGIVSSTTKSDRESDGEYIMRSITAKIQGFAIGYGIGWMAGWLMNGEIVMEARALEGPRTPYRHYQTGMVDADCPQVDAAAASMGSLAMLKARERCENPMQPAEDHTYMYKWQPGTGRPVTGIKMCASERALCDHVLSVGGQLLEIIEVDGKKATLVP